MQVLLASRNAKKLGELRRILAPVLPHVEVVGLDDVPAYPEVPESGATFAENALIKARKGSCAPACRRWPTTPALRSTR